VRCHNKRIVLWNIEFVSAGNLMPGSKQLPAKLPAKSSADARASNEQVCLITQAKAV
jgi:hypothetical protein